MAPRRNRASAGCERADRWVAERWRRVMRWSARTRRGGEWSTEVAVMTYRRFGILSIIVVFVTAATFIAPATADPGAEKARPCNVSLDFAGTDATFDCPDGFVYGGQAGTGNLPHLGQVEISGVQCSNFATLEITDGFGTYVGANDDSIDIEYSRSAVLVPEGFLGSGTAVIVGGTGRFASASGAFDLTFTTFLFPDAPGRTLLEREGWIAHDASDRGKG